MIGRWKRNSDYSMIIRNKPRDRRLEHARRKNKDPFYSSARWRTLRRVVLAEQPLCVDPFGYHAADRRTVLAAEVDHLIPRVDCPDLELDAANCQSLCRSCHSMKTGIDQRVAADRNRGEVT